MSAVIGALRAELSASIAQFESDMGRAAKAVGNFGKAAGRIGQQVSAAGRSMSIGITAPVLAFGIAAGKTAGDFEAAMNRVEAASGASGKELKALKDQARAFGRDKQFTATAKDAADAMENLAKNGLSVTQILDGAEKATLKMSAATGANFSDSADVATGAMQQFGKSAKDLDKVVDQVTGVLLVSKFGFDDYKLAMGQAGGVAGGLGLTLEDFNTVLGATSALFASGSDAGTSFKTFLTRLAPQSKQASDVMTQFGLKFFDATGKMKSMGEIAQILKDKLGNLSDEAKNKALTTIFGTDAMRTAIGLMNQGADGLQRIQDEIAKSSAATQMAARMKGLNGSFQQLRKQLEALFLAVADSGFLDWVTKAVGQLTDLVQAASGLPKPVLAFATAAAGVVAVIGPLLLGLGGALGLLKNLSPAVGIAAGAVGAIGNAVRIVGVLISAFVGGALRGMILAMAIQFPAAAGAMVTAIRGIQAAMAFLTGPWGLALAALAAAIGLVVWNINNIPPPSKAAKKVTDDLAKASDEYAQAAGRAAKATDQERLALLQTAIAKKVAAEQTLKAAEASLRAAEATLAEVDANEALARQISGSEGGIDLVGMAAEGIRKQSRSDIEAQKAAIAKTRANIADADALLKAAMTPVPAAKLGGGGAKANPFVATFGDSSADKVKNATAKFAEAIRDMNDKVAHGLDDQELPKATAAAEALRRKIVDITQDAKDSGVAIGDFAGQIGALKDRIKTLELEGLQKEAEAFSREVNKSGRAVNEFSKGGLDPLAEKLAQVDDTFEGLRDRITAEIEANRVLADKSVLAAMAMKVLQDQLAGLDKAHQAATDAATAQYKAEQRLADLHAQADVASARRDIQDLKQASGRNGIMGQHQQELQGIQRGLDDQKQQATEHLAELEGQLDEARRVGDQAAISRLQTQVGVQQELLDLVSQTQTTQISQHQLLQESWNHLTDGLADKFGEMLVNWKFDLDGLKSVFRSWAQSLASSAFKQGGDMLGNAIKGWAKGGFKIPGFASGASFKVGGMGGIDRNLVAFRARADETVTVTRPGETVSGGRGDVNFYVTTPNADSFRRSQRQMARDLKQTLARV
jgi:TP901 family phage tail tape measure protein